MKERGDWKYWCMMFVVTLAAIIVANHEAEIRELVPGSTGTVLLWLTEAALYLGVMVGVAVLVSRRAARKAETGRGYLRHDLTTAQMILLDTLTALVSFTRELWEFDHACTKCIRINHALPAPVSKLMPSHEKLKKKIKQCEKLIGDLWIGVKAQLDTLEPDVEHAKEPMSVRLREQTQ